MQCDGHVCSETYASNLNCMFTSVPGHIVDFIEFI